MGSEMSESCLKSDSVNIREVWDDNLEQEFALIRDIVDEYPYIAMDTEFPGIVLASLRKESDDPIFHALKANVDLLKLIQLGLTFTDENGNLPTCGTGKYCIWQFNFREFNINEDAYAIDSIQLLKRCGIDFEKNSQKGVDARRFSELLMSSGVVLNDSVVWVTFHSAYDFGYLLKVLSWKNLPDTQAGYFELLRIYFPVYYDVKYMLRFCNGLYGGLSKVAEMLNIQRIGMCHQAGSDSLLTSALFMKLKQDYLSDSLEKVVGLLYGIIENKA